MRHRLKQLLLITAIPALTALTQGALSVKKWREPGDILDISIRQELDHASYNGITWLKQRQKRDGSFGEKNQIRCTALVILALSGDESSNNAETISNAVQWLMKELKTNGTTNINTAAWSCAALTVGQAINPGDLPQCATPVFLKRKHPETSGNTAHLCSEILLSIDPDANNLKLKRKEVNETNYHHDGISLEEIWINSRSINSRGGVLLAKKGNRIDWRGIYAKKMIGKQKIDSGGGGYWEGSTTSETICNTALSIINFKEL